MPINYGSQIEEHLQVRQQAGVFDVSHMTVIDVTGGDAKPFLRYLLANDVDKLAENGSALYSAMLNRAGGVVDDLIVYLRPNGYRLVVNCATREKDLAWITGHSPSFDVQVEEQPELAILAVHGPDSIDKLCSLLPEDQARQVQALGNFQGVEFGDWQIARTGYTGEKGLELIFPAGEAPGLWRKLLAADVRPVGLAARDTLRLEAGMNLYGQDMDETVSPLSANMKQTIAWDPQNRDFIGRDSVTEHRRQLEQGQLPVLAGLVLESRGVLRHGQKVITNAGEGIITSGSYSPTLKQSIALARIPLHAQDCQVDLRGNLVPVRKVQPNFVRQGKKLFN